MNKGWRRSHRQEESQTLKQTTRRRQPSVRTLDSLYAHGHHLQDCVPGRLTEITHAGFMWYLGVITTNLMKQYENDKPHKRDVRQTVPGKKAWLSHRLTGPSDRNSSKSEWPLTRWRTGSAGYKTTKQAQSSSTVRKKWEVWGGTFLYFVCTYVYNKQIRLQLIVIVVFCYDHSPRMLHKESRQGKSKDTNRTHEIYNMDFSGSQYFSDIEHLKPNFKSNKMNKCKGKNSNCALTSIIVVASALVLSHILFSCFHGPIRNIVLFTGS